MMKRIIPILLLKDKLLYKTINFDMPKYIGDPFVALKIFNDKEVDELIVLDIDKSKKKKAPDTDFLESLASEAFMPVGYGGGITTADQAREIFNIGFEKVILNSILNSDLNLIKEISKIFGSQAVVASVDYKMKYFTKKRFCVFKNGKISSQLCPKELAISCERAGAGEILLHCVSYEGKMDKMDVDFIKEVVEEIDIPVIGSGGAPNSSYITEFFLKTHASALAAGSIFIYYGKYNAVLINYPSYEDKKNILDKIEKI